MAEDEKIEKLQAQMIDVLNLQKELKEQIPATKEEYLNLALKCLKNREGLREIIYIVVPQHLRKELLSKLDAKDSIHNDPIIKKAQEKFQEIKDGSKSADSGGILGGAKKKRNIDLKADEEPLELYELYMKDKEQYYFKKTTFPFTEFNNMIHLGIGEIKIGRVDLEKMILELRNNIYGFDKEEWFTNIEKQIGYDYKKDLKRILEERKHIRDEKKE